MYRRPPDARLRPYLWSILAILPILCQLLTDPLLAQETARDSWKGNVAVGVDASGGNRSLVILRADFGVTYLRTDRAEFDLTGAWRYGENQGSVIERQLRGAAKLDITPNADWTPFLFTNAFRDPVRRRLDLRMETGAGAKFTFARWSDGKASLSGAGLWTLEHFTQDANLDAAPDRNEGRVSWRTKIEHDFAGGRTSVEQVSFYQPVWNDWEDFIFVAQSALQTRVVGSLSLLVRHEYLHDETPAEGVLKDDWSLSVSFKYDF